MGKVFFLHVETFKKRNTEKGTQTKGEREKNVYSVEPLAGCPAAKALQSQRWALAGAYVVKLAPLSDPCEDSQVSPAPHAPKAPRYAPRLPGTLVRVGHRCRREHSQADQPQFDLRVTAVQSRLPVAITLNESRWCLRASPDYVCQCGFISLASWTLVGGSFGLNVQRPLLETFPEASGSCLHVLGSCRWSKDGGSVKEIFRGEPARSPTPLALDQRIGRQPRGQIRRKWAVVLASCVLISAFVLTIIFVNFWLSRVVTTHGGGLFGSCFACWAVLQPRAPSMGGVTSRVSYTENWVARNGGTTDDDSGNPDTEKTSAEGIAFGEPKLVKTESSTPDGEQHRTRHSDLFKSCVQYAENPQEGLESVLAFLFRFKLDMRDMADDPTEDALTRMVQLSFAYDVHPLVSFTGVYDVTSDASAPFVLKIELRTEVAELSSVLKRMKAQDVEELYEFLLNRYALVQNSNVTHQLLDEDGESECMLFRPTH
ncbi:hypothetical protein HPB48_011837 [Haemaphysalis longicornis]|uniref:Uncharacterized protein n=1 Tax=Haemaphysalis longicornis TaxID=44386 RepID=A0A9J6GVQ0_HAELO|nr:hypothetical protein HPB48_011837 [Haemaphysalis longicornis]